MIQKHSKVFLKKVLSLCVQNGPFCFLCISCSTFITIFLLWEKVELHQHNVQNSTVWATQNQPVEQITTKQVTKSLSEVLKSIPLLNEDVLLFNRVPNSGSELLVVLLQWLQDFNGFRHIRLSAGRKHRRNRYEQEKLVESIVSKVRNGALPFTFDCHVFFVNFTSFGRQSPTYLNLVRNPIDKAISRFHHPHTPAPTVGTRFLPYRTKSKKIYPLIEEFERCVQMDDPKCTYTSRQFYELTIPYFCGHNKWCMLLNDKWALEKAKQNVEKYYPVVGILEELNTTLLVLEHKLPYFFRNVLEIYNIKVSDRNRIRELSRPSGALNQKIRSKLQNQLLTEYEFYDWLLQRLNKQYQEAISALN